MEDTKMKGSLAPTAPVGALLLRLTLVGYWAIHWWFKVGYRGMPATESFFNANGLPSWLAWFDISYEVLIVALLLSGFLFRFACLSSLPILIASMILYGKNGFYFPSGGIELPILWALVQTWLVLIGPGALSFTLPMIKKSALIDWVLH
jgi:putative oxidoreductase